VPTDPTATPSTASVKRVLGLLGLSTSYARTVVDEEVDLADVLDLEARVRIDHVTGSAVRLDGGGRDKGAFHAHIYYTTKKNLRRRGLPVC